MIFRRKYVIRIAGRIGIGLWCMMALPMAAGCPSDNGDGTFHLGLGWNLGNQLDAFADGAACETCWGNPPATQQTFDKVAEAGFTAVRIPVTWLGHVGDAPDYRIDEVWMERVAQLVGYAEHAGLKVIVNMHHDGADSRYWLNVKASATDEEENRRIKCRLDAMWRQIAGRFKDKGDFLMFESMNEIHDGAWGWGENLTDGGRQYEVVNQWNQVFVDAVRSSGGWNETRYLGIPGYCANPDLTVKHFKLPEDKANHRLCVAVHFYDPCEFTLSHEQEEWGHDASGKEGRTDDEHHVDSVFNVLKTAFVDNGIPVYIGEFGCVRRTRPEAERFRQYYLEYVCRSAGKHGLSLLLWDNGSYHSGAECSGYLDHATGEYIHDAGVLVEAMRQAYKEK